MDSGRLSSDWLWRQRPARHQHADPRHPDGRGGVPDGPRPHALGLAPRLLPLHVGQDEHLRHLRGGIHPGIMIME